MRLTRSWLVTLKAATAAIALAAGLLVHTPTSAAQESEPYAGYLFTYFTGEGSSNGEQIYFALSRGNDPLRWRELNGGKPVLTSRVGERGMRDPFIIRSADGSKFYQIATDLRIYGNGDWNRAQRHGSKSIVVSESDDLVNWSTPRLERVSPDTAGNTWAPEAFYDDTLGAYVVFWASKIYAANDPDHTGSSYNRMMYATTQDFRTFSPAREWYNPGYSVIDSTVLEHNGTYYRYTKDERGGATCGKYITSHTSTSLTSTNWRRQAECIGQGTISRGEGPLVFKSNTENRWYQFIDEYGGRGYVPFETTDLPSGHWTESSSYDLPSSPRHGTVLPVTAAEYDRLEQTYSGGSGDAVTLAARHSGKCADVASSSTANGATLQQWSCHDGTNQQWTLRDLGNGYMQLVAQHSGKCLDVASSSTANGATLQQWSCHDGTNQQWQLRDAGDGYVSLVARHSGKCVDVSSRSSADGARLLQWSCHGGTNQQWRRSAA
ncbi:RICIN domain-containing protein [Streptomyces sp. TRM68367]|nr:RICIN domain-containing protein [Streptomyces sp. TRM68367]MBC9730383.1 RICIN domain-containing protein [Streptomyces sp. TRM68367]